MSLPHRDAEPAIRRQTEAVRIGTVGRPLGVLEPVQVERAVLGGGEEHTRVALPRDARRHVSVLAERSERDERPLPVPDVDATVDEQRGAGDVVLSLRPPHDAAHGRHGRYGPHQPDGSVQSIPDLDGLVPSGGGQPAGAGRMPVTGVGWSVMGCQRAHAAIGARLVPQLDLSVLRDRRQRVGLARVELEVPHALRVSLERHGHVPLPHVKQLHRTVLRAGDQNMRLRRMKRDFVTRALVLGEHMILLVPAGLVEIPEHHLSVCGSRRQLGFVKRVPLDVIRGERQIETLADAQVESLDEAVVLDVEHLEDVPAGDHYLAVVLVEGERVGRRLL